MTDKLIPVHTENGFQTGASINCYFYYTVTFNY